MALGEKSISPTGNPFVDTGLAVIAALADLDDVQEEDREFVQRQKAMLQKGFPMSKLLYKRRELQRGRK